MRSFGVGALGNQQVRRGVGRDPRQLLGRRRGSAVSRNEGDFLRPGIERRAPAHDRGVIARGNRRLVVDEFANLQVAIDENAGPLQIAADGAVLQQIPIGEGILYRLRPECVRRCGRAQTEGQRLRAHDVAAGRKREHRVLQGMHQCDAGGEAALIFRRDRLRDGYAPRIWPGEVQAFGLQQAFHDFAGNVIDDPVFIARLLRNRRLRGRRLAFERILVRRVKAAPCQSDRGGQTKEHQLTRALIPKARYSSIQLIVAPGIGQLNCRSLIGMVSGGPGPTDRMR